MALIVHFFVFGNLGGADRASDFTKRSQIESSRGDGLVASGWGAEEQSRYRKGRLYDRLC